MLEDTILGTAVGTLILLFFMINYWFSARGHKMERVAQSKNQIIPCPHCGTVLRSSDSFCPKCNIRR